MADDDYEVPCGLCSHVSHSAGEAVQHSQDAHSSQVEDDD